MPDPVLVSKDKSWYARLILLLVREIGNRGQI